MTEKEWQNGYRDYEKLGDSYGERNCNQSFLCYENAEYLCQDESEKTRIRQKKEQMTKKDGFGVRPTSIVIVSYNCMYMMQRCLESIRNTCSKEMCEVIIVDNASTDGVREWLIEQEDEKIILLEQNMGFPIGCNVGVQYAEPENDIFLLNNDTRMTPNALFWLRMGLYEKEDIGACGCVANYCGNAQDIDVQFTLPGEYVKYGESLNVYRDNPYEERNRLSGFAMLVKRCVWDTVEGMDEAYTPGYMEDDDLSMKIRKTGYRIWICHNSYIYHAGSQSFAKHDDAELERIFTKNYYYLVDKWQFNLLGKSAVDAEAISQITREPNDVFSVLQLGAGCGATLARIKYKYPNAEVYGIDDCSDAVEVAPKGCNVVYWDCVEADWPWENMKFDYLICKEDKWLGYQKYLKKDGIKL